MSKGVKHMKDNNRPNIGFLTCHLDNDYAFEICKGVEYAAEEADVNLIVFPGKATASRRTPQLLTQKPPIFSRKKLFSSLAFYFRIG